MRARRWPTRCCAAPRSRRSSPPVASRCTSPASRPIRCNRCRCPSRRRMQRRSARSEAVQLFVERAQRQLPDFELTAARAPAVAELCIHLDGIPLALELAAARVRSLSIEQINARLNDRFKLLTGGTRTALPRQQTLRATLDWSYDLLGGAGARGAAAAGDLRRRLHARSRLGGRVRRGDRRIRGDRPALAARRALAGRRRYERCRCALPAARDDARLRAGEARRSRRDRRHPDAGTRSTSAIGSSAHTTTGCACPMPTGAPSTCRNSTTFALRSTGRSVPMATRRSASRSPAPRERCGRSSSLFGEGRQRLEAAVARVGSQTPESDQARLWLWLGSCWDTARRPRRWQPWSEPSTCIVGWATRRDSAIRSCGWARMLAFMGRFEQAAPVLAEAFPVLERAGAAEGARRLLRQLRVL